MSTETVILLHGIWMPGAEMLLLKRKLEKSRRFHCHVFAYPSVRKSLQENADRLFDFTRKFDNAVMHFVGHSLGGVVALRMLATHEHVPPGRVVCLGSPLCGSRAAAVLTRSRWGQGIVGPTLLDGVVREPASCWALPVTEARDVGVIAGTVAIGMGRLVTRFDVDNDGTVAVDETRLPGIRDHLCVSVNHTALVTSPQVASQVSAFLSKGLFAQYAVGT